jgi:cell filamentation protein, protein adenylyltransferase
MTRGRPNRESVYQRLDTQIAELWQRMGGLPSPLEAADIWRDIWYEEAHHSTAIEGNTLVRREVEQLLRDGRAVGAKQLKEYMEVKGYADAAGWVYRQGIQPGRWDPGNLITLTEVREIHQSALAPVWDVEPHPEAGSEERPGQFRRHEIEAFPAGMKPPTWPLVEADMSGWLEEARRLEARTPEFPEALARVHCRFEQIHPFIDGNGRAGRLILNLLLVRLGYPPAIIYKHERAAYLAALRRADASECGALGEFLVRAILQNLHKFIVPAVAGPARIVPLAALADESLSANALRVAATRGVLAAVKGADGQWRSSRKWVDEYRANRYKRRLTTADGRPARR